MAPPRTSLFEPTSGEYFSRAYNPTMAGLSLSERQEVLNQAVQGIEGAREALETWTRKDLLQLICLEMGKERKYTGISKSKMVEHLLRLVSTKELREGVDPSFTSPTSHFPVPQNLSRRQRKAGRPARVPSVIPAPADESIQTAEPSWLCRNTACKAQLPQGVSFCQRCSCCICKKFDDNKDPSLWIVCTPEPLNVEMDCRLSCHIECALNNDMAGVVSDGPDILLDGSYQCCSCGKISDLIGCWKKQLLVAKDARRVDTLCQRLSLSYRLLSGTQKHKALHEVVAKAIQKLEAEVGSITEGSAKFARGLVNRLSSSSEVLELVVLALQKAAALDKRSVMSHKAVETVTLQEKNVGMLCTIEFDDISSSSISLTVKGGGELVTGYRIWHRKACDATFANNPTCIITSNPGRAQISSLQAATEYAIYIVPFFERGIGEPAEARCFTESAESESPREACEDRHLNAGLNIVNIEEDVCISDKLKSSFKVRELGKVLHSAWAEENHSAHVRKGIFCSKGGVEGLIDRKNNEEKKPECASPGLNVISSPGADVNLLNNSTFKVSPEKTPSSELNASVNLEAGVEESRVTVEVAPSLIRTLSRRNSSVLLPEGAGKGQTTCAEVTDLDDTSDPGNSHTSQREETEALSQVVSDVMQTNAANELHEALEDGRKIGDGESNGHGESWAVQVRSAGATIGMEPQTAIMRKRTSEGLGRGDNYGLMNGCGGSVGGPLCAARNYEFCVKIVRWLECEGYLKEDFRMKFLTWFSLKASEHEKRVVSVFIDTLQDNPQSLAGQLVDTFSDIISSKRHHVVSNGFGNKLWH